MTGPHDAVVDLLDRFRPDAAEVVADTSPVEGGLFVPVADAHDLPPGAMVFGQVLQGVVVRIQPQPHGRQHQNLPVIQPGTSAAGAGFSVDVAADQLQNRISQFRLRINELQGFQNGDDLRPAIRVERDLKDRRGILCSPRRSPYRETRTLCFQRFLRSPASIFEEKLLPFVHKTKTSTLFRTDMN
jgi:hypothetical protein